MSTADALIVNLPRTAILQQLRAGSSRPVELLDKLGSKFEDTELKEALLRLLQEGEVVLTADRQLKLSEAA